MHDLRGSDVLLARILADVKQFLADKAYDAAKRVLDLLEQHDVEAVIPPRANRKEQRLYDEEAYKWRHLVENLFQKLKQLKSDSHKIRQNSRCILGEGVHLAVSVIWLN